ncbi:uncharacterized protein Z518_06019 [Rhinocladiella mackenziei CBS 650.93]|uniref:Rhinocladiella mackenziei CBS 650.93 unplaced genomic scaffold supercont1.4, whole genome shotgun sequence n=1 Tax=Rhinocladiella mackenziei CBS 650.93 TaxID=1442369 RepID=A0A0D2FSP5_9EURO|nr:uncharacterized protein Z518_06019 [Rhinocladiella mackenziei CBS 650.93]KIX05147.1 hypothetical protein Z518_06019 [Rhinocladiella mackenziei CBS 650.93]
MRVFVPLQLHNLLTFASELDERTSWTRERAQLLDSALNTVELNELVTLVESTRWDNTPVMVQLTEPANADDSLAARPASCARKKRRINPSPPGSSKDYGFHNGFIGHGHG